MGKSKKKSTFFKDFKAFISRGNVMDMAVGVVIGASFGKIVSGLVNYILNPVIGLFIKSGSLDGLKTVITPADEAAGVAEVAILWGTWFQTILDFLITALCVFVILRVFVKTKAAIENKLNEEALAKAKAAAEAAELEKKQKEEADAEAHRALEEKQARLEASTLQQEALLSEIRDLLRDRK